jgi:histidinol-phosphate/aromatic aminotransferase/cobyric acid decarboxylase-like protein
MMGIKQPYNVNTAAEIAGLAALKHRAEIMVRRTAWSHCLVALPGRTA